jgi:hypothetical protein
LPSGAPFDVIATTPALEIKNTNLFKKMKTKINGNTKTQKKARNSHEVNYGD